MMILFVGDAGPYCDIGILKYAPDHVANLLITKIPRVGAPETILHLHQVDLESRTWLDVQKRDPLIRLFRDTSEVFDRPKDKGNPADYRWALNFESDEMYRGKVTIDPAGFKSVLRINDGTFYTQQKSENSLVLKRGSAATELGKVAVRLRSEIALARSDVAYFSNGANGVQIPLRPEAQVDYGIYVSQIRHDHVPGHSPANHEAIDAENYNSAIAVDLPPSRKIHFDRGSRATPDSVCFTPTMSNG